MTRTDLILRAGAVLLAFSAAGCGVRGAPTPAPPLFGATDLPPVVPQPYQRALGAAPQTFPANLYEEPPEEALEAEARAAEDAAVAAGDAGLDGNPFTPQ